MKKCLLITLLVFIVINGMLLIGYGIPDAKGQNSIELSLNLGIPETHLRYQYVLKPWIERIGKRSQGKIKITPYFMESLSPRNEAYNSAAKGMADLAEGVQQVTPGKFPFSEVMLLPSIGTPLVVGVKCQSPVLWKLFQTVPEIQAEYKGVKVLSLYSCAMESVMMRDKPIRKLEDLRGMKIHVNGRTKVMTIKYLGATPISMPYGDVYLSLEKGVIDGGVFPDELLKSRGFAEQLKYVIPLNLSHTNFFLVMNPKKWNSLPPEFQAIFEEESYGKLALLEGEAELKMREEASEWAKRTHGVKYLDLSSQEKLRWKRASEKAIDEWVEEMEKRGLPGRKVYELRLQYEKDFAEETHN